MIFYRGKDQICFEFENYPKKCMMQKLKVIYVMGDIDIDRKIQ